MTWVFSCGVLECSRRLLLGDDAGGSQRGARGTKRVLPKTVTAGFSDEPLSWGKKHLPDLGAHVYPMGLMSPGLCHPCPQATRVLSRWKINIGVYLFHIGSPAEEPCKWTLGVLPCESAVLIFCVDGHRVFTKRGCGVSLSFTFSYPVLVSPHCHVLCHPGLWCLTPPVLRAKKDCRPGFFPCFTCSSLRADTPASSHPRPSLLTSGFALAFPGWHYLPWHKQVISRHQTLLCRGPKPKQTPVTFSKFHFSDCGQRNERGIFIKQE